MKLFFDRTAPFYVVEEASFDAVPVEMPESTLTYVKNVHNIISKMQKAIENAPAPEESAQNLADYLTDLIGEASGGE